MDDLTIESYDLQDEIFRIRHVKEKIYTEMRSTHFHDGFELYYLLRGEKLFFVNDQLFHAGKGDLVIIHPYDVHKTSSVKDLEAERIVVHFKEEFIERQIGMENFNLAYLKELPYKIHLTVQEQKQVERILNEMLKECEMKEEQHRLYIKPEIFIAPLVCWMNCVYKDKYPCIGGFMSRDFRLGFNNSVIQDGISKYIN